MKGRTAVERDDIVDKQITDGVTQSNVMVVAGSPSVSIAQTGFALAQSQSVLFANMVSGQQQQSMANGASIIRGVIEMYEENNRTKSQKVNDGTIRSLASLVKGNNNDIDF